VGVGQIKTLRALHLAEVLSALHLTKNASDPCITGGSFEVDADDNMCLNVAAPVRQGEEVPKGPAAISILAGGGSRDVQGTERGWPQA